MPGSVAIPPDSYINGKPIVYFRTYAGAAYKACQHGLLTPLEACAVIQDCCLCLRAEGETNPNDPAFPSKLFFFPLFIFLVHIPGDSK